MCIIDRYITFVFDVNILECFIVIRLCRPSLSQINVDIRFEQDSFVLKIFVKIMRIGFDLQSEIITSVFSLNIFRVNGAVTIGVALFAVGIARL